MCGLIAERMIMDIGLGAGDVDERSVARIYTGSVCVIEGSFVYGIEVGGPVNGQMC